MKAAVPERKNANTDWMLQQLTMPSSFLIKPYEHIFSLNSACHDLTDRHKAVKNRAKSPRRNLLINYILGTDLRLKHSKHDAVCKYTQVYTSPGTRYYI